MLESVVVAVGHVLVYQILLGWWGAAHAEDDLNLLGHKDFEFSDQHEHFLVDKLTAEFGQVEASTHEQLVVGSFVFEGSFFWTHVMVLGRDLRVDQQVVELLVGGVDVDLVLHQIKMIVVQINLTSIKLITSMSQVHRSIPNNRC